MDSNRIFSLLQIEQIYERINKLKLNASWNFIVQSMTANYIYSIEKAIEDGLKDKQINKADKGEEPLKV